MGLRAGRFLLSPPRAVDLAQGVTDSPVTGIAGNGTRDRSPRRFQTPLGVPG